MWSEKCGVVSVTTSRSPDIASRKNHPTQQVSSAAPATQSDDGGRQSAAPATEIATHLRKSWQKYCACYTNHFWHVMKHCGMSRSATPATQNNMIACCETFTKDGFCNFPHRHTKEAGASKRAFRARRPYISHFTASKSTFSYKFSYEPTAKSTFRARLPSLFITCHKRPPLPRNLHLATTSHSTHNAIRRKHATRHV